MGFYKKILKKLAGYYYVWLLKRSRLFDPLYYFEKYPDIWDSGLSPEMHYLRYGGKEGRDPSQHFSTGEYLSRRPDVILSGINPLIHYIRFGRREEISNKGLKEKLDDFGQKGKSVTRQIFHHHDLQLIKNSPWFNAEFYLQMNPDIQEAGIDPALHYLFYGWKEGRSPGTTFDPYYYMLNYKDVPESKMNPLIHYLKFGQQEGRLPRPFVHDEKIYTGQADITQTEVPEDYTFQSKIAVVCHLYHLELMQEMMAYILKIDFPYHLYLTISEENREKVVSSLSGMVDDQQVTLITVPNRGRDIAPFLSVLETHLTSYDLVCKIHTKKSPHDLNLQNWRKYLLDQLLGTTQLIRRIIYEFETDQQLGMIWPVPHQYLEVLKMSTGWGNESTATPNALRAASAPLDIDIHTLPEDFEFPAGSMFWFRPGALSHWPPYSVLDPHFEEESGQTDGTLAHVCERLFGIMCLQAGYTCKKVYFMQQTTENQGNAYPVSGEYCVKILFIAHDMALAGAQMILFNIIQWLRLHTVVEPQVLVLQKGSDGGLLAEKFMPYTPLIFWEDLLQSGSRETAVQGLMEKTGTIDLIYGNTVVSARLYPLLSEYKVPFITHVHELEGSIRQLLSHQEILDLQKYTTTAIACSEAVRSNLLRNHGFHQDNTTLVYEFIETSINMPEDIKILRQNLGLPADKKIIWGCGTVSHRKGTDLFVETARILKESGVRNFVFYWIGDHYWYKEQNFKLSWDEWEDTIAGKGLEGMVHFLGILENPKDYLAAGDIFFLSSREDPYPLVCLEAAECGLPVICFDGAGGMPEFVGEDCGKIVPFLDTDQAAEAIHLLVENNELRTRLGKGAREKLLSRHTHDIAVPSILHLCRTLIHNPYPVSVVVPVYNQSAFLEKRLSTIFNQTFRDLEIWVLDDASTDNSVVVAESFSWYPSLRIVQNENNTGSPFAQWRKGIALSRGQYIWIAEGDDYAQPLLLEKLLKFFTDPDIKLAYCNSDVVIDNGGVLEGYYIHNGHYHHLDVPYGKWLEDYINEGQDEVLTALAIRNTLPNASAVLFRRSAFEGLNWEEVMKYHTAGDWYIYLSMLKKGKIAYCKMALNVHRRHSQSVVAGHKHIAGNTLGDYFQIHKRVVEEFEVSDDTVRKMADSVCIHLRKIWPDLSDEEFEAFYDKNELLSLQTSHDNK
ncbi:MAG TPA: rhamnan synthesis F family protein [Saprospiraceae bacterium]|nr:rhamnan synthesis F family protein [Saprospiraceae bacterium]